MTTTRPWASDTRRGPMAVTYQSARIPAAGVVLEADIALPERTRGLVLFARRPHRHAALGHTTARSAGNRVDRLARRLRTRRRPAHWAVRRQHRRGRCAAPSWYRQSCPA